MRKEQRRGYKLLVGSNMEFFSIAEYEGTSIVLKDFVDGKNLMHSQETVVYVAYKDECTTWNNFIDWADKTPHRKTMVEVEEKNFAWIADKTSVKSNLMDKSKAHLVNIIFRKDQIHSNDINEINKLKNILKEFEALKKTSTADIEQYKEHINELDAANSRSQKIINKLLKDKDMLEKTKIKLLATICTLGAALIFGALIWFAIK